MRITRFQITTGRYFLRLHLFALGKRWRLRALMIKPWCWYKWLTEVFAEGAVHRLWIGPLLVVVMEDAEGMTNA